MEMQLSFARRHRRVPLNAIAATWCRLVESVFNPYRPELYYMRGPGPKWHAKHQGLIENAGR